MRQKLSVRFRNLNIFLFTTAFCLMAMVMLASFFMIVGEISSGYAKHYAASSADALNARIEKAISLMAKAAHSAAVADWLSEEGDLAKRRLAYEELSGIIDELYNKNIYVGFEQSLNEYTISEDNLSGDFQLVDRLDRDDPEDAWYFQCIESDKEYLLNVGVDHVVNRKRVWLDYKIVRDGKTLGVICTGLEFSQVAGELFAQYDNVHMRGLVVAADGNLVIDSLFLGNEAYLSQEYETRIENVFSDPGILVAIRSRLDSINEPAMAGGPAVSGEPVMSSEPAVSGEPVVSGDPEVVKLTSGAYRYLTLAPIAHTEWMIVILSSTSSLLELSQFIPIAALTLVLLILFALATHRIGHRLIFRPLAKLNHSLELLHENHGEGIYGLDRDDELGNLAHTIQDLFTKANFDALTGIRNRRFLETHLARAVKWLSRSHGALSVLMIDVDYFKKYNDTYGHKQGDICLREVAQAICGSVTREIDFAARYGGEEFAVVLPETGREGACLVAEEIMEKVRALGLPHSASEIAPMVTVSIGVTTGKATRAQTWEAYTKSADIALYQAKGEGRNRYAFRESEN